MNPISNSEAGAKIYELGFLAVFLFTPGGSNRGFIIVQGYHLQILSPSIYGILSEIQGYHL